MLLDRVESSVVKARIYYELLCHILWHSVMQLHPQYLTITNFGTPSLAYQELYCYNSLSLEYPDWVLVEP